MSVARCLALVIAGPVLLAGCTSGPSAEDAADTVYINGRIYTVDEAQPWAEAVAIKDGTFLVVGSTVGVEAVTGDGTQVVDLEGQLVLPGLHDVHAHPGTGGVGRVSECSLPGTLEAPSWDDLLQAFRECGEQFPGDGWLRGGGYTPSAIPEGAYNKATLDELFPDRPVFLLDETGHNGWVNSRGIEVAGIRPETKLPPGNSFGVDETTGELNGRLIEVAAMDAVREKLPADSPETLVSGLQAAVREAHENGVTAWFGAAEAGEERFLPAWKQLAASGSLKIHTRISQLAIGFGGEESFSDGEAIAKLIAPYEGLGFEVRAAKIFVDGTAEGGTAGFLEPAGKNNDLGSLTASVEKLREIVASLDERGFQVKAHAIGDRAVREIVNAFEAVIDKRGGNPLRHHVGHAGHVHPDEYPRFAALGIPVESNIGQAAPMGYMTDVVKPVLPDTMWEENTYPFGKIVEAGAVFGAASDWSSLPFAPFYAMGAAVTDPRRPELGVWSLENRMTLEQIIEAYTMGGAYIMHLETETGSIEKGKAADMVVVDRNLFEIDPMEIFEAQAIMTIFAGEVVYDGRDGAAADDEPYEWDRGERYGETGPDA